MGAEEELLRNEGEEQVMNVEYVSTERGIFIERQGPGGA